MLQNLFQESQTLKSSVPLTFKHCTSHNATPCPPSPPGKSPQDDRRPRSHCHSCKRPHVALSPKALLTLSFRASTIHSRVDRPPHRRTTSRHHGHDAPIRAEILHAPYHADEHWRERENGAVADTDKCSDDGEKLRKALHERCGEEELPNGEDEAGCEKQAGAGERAELAGAFVTGFWGGCEEVG